MYKFNNNNVLTGYIKELLHSFNLPRCHVFQSESDFKNYFLDKDGIGLVKNYKDNSDYICIIKSGKTQPRAIYSYGHLYPNVTDKLILSDTVYDYHTHTYLGDYLRFIRDYKNLDLMCLYNCFSGQVLEYADKHYLIIPVRFNKKYTIAYTGSYKYKFTFKTLPEDLYNDFLDQKEIIYSKKSSFRKPYIVESGIVRNKLYDEKNYKLVIQIDKDVNNQLTVLEGDFSNSNSEYYPTQYNFDKDISYNNMSFNSQVKNLQLLKEHYGLKHDSYPFSDKLIGYLTDMTITPIDTISNNIISAKYKVYERYGNNPNNEGIIEYNNIESKLGKLNSSFDNNLRARFLDAYNQSKYTARTSYDMLGYVDKDIERCIDDETRDPKIRR